MYFLLLYGGFLLVDARSCTSRLLCTDLFVFFFLFSSMEFFTGLVLNLLQTICEDNVWTGRQIVSQLCVLQLLHSDSLFL